MTDQTRLYVGGLPWATNYRELKAAFEAAGTVIDAVISVDKFNGRSRGFGFVSMSTDEEAQRAIEMWDEKEFNGRVLKVKIADPRGTKSQETSFDRDLDI